jgi:hypothetical protein
MARVVNAPYHRGHPGRAASGAALTLDVIAHMQILYPSVTVLRANSALLTDAFHTALRAARGAAERER